MANETEVLCDSLSNEKTEEIEKLLNLPNGYSYECRRDGEQQQIHVCIKEVVDEDAALNWMNELQVKSQETWRITKTERGGRVNSFKQFRYCQHAARKDVRGIRSSKSTGCTATLQITVHRHLPKSKSKVKDRIRTDWPTVVTFRSRHNHSTSSAAILKHRDMSSSTRQRLFDLFRQGHSASSALRCLKTDYLIQYGANYYLYDGDGYYIPSLSIINHLFTREFVPKTNEQADKCTESLEESLEDSLEENSHQNKTEANSSPQTSLQERDMARLDALMARIKQGLTDSPESFVPACLQMLSNADKYAVTENGLLSAMHTFGKYSGLSLLRRQPHLAAGRPRGVQIGVQPTAVGRPRKLNLSGKRKLSAGRPLGIRSATSLVHLVGHDYTNLGSLPGRKRKAPHNLQQCVYANTGLEANKQCKLH